MLIKILFNYIIGYIRISVEGYYIERFINICRNNKIVIWNLKRDKNVKLELNIGIKDLKRLRRIVRQTKCKMKIIRKSGLPFLFNRYKKRILIGSMNQPAKLVNIPVQKPSLFEKASPQTISIRITEKNCQPVLAFFLACCSYSSILFFA